MYADRLNLRGLVSILRLMIRLQLKLLKLAMPFRMTVLVLQLITVILALTNNRFCMDPEVLLLVLCFLRELNLAMDRGISNQGPFYSFGQDLVPVFRLW